MINPIRLLLPALIPSWNFFDAVSASPRVEYALNGGEWIAFAPRPQHVSVAGMAGRLLWNARWNEALFVVSCAERLLNNPTAHSEDEIFRRVAASLPGVSGALTFRIVLVDGEGREVAYTAKPRAVP